MRILPFDKSLKMAEDLIKLESGIFGDGNYNSEEIIEVLSDENNKVFLAYDGVIPVGFVSTMKVNTIQYRGIWIDLLGVVEERRGEGIGDSLVKVAFEYAGSVGVDMISALVRETNTPSRRTMISNKFSETTPFRLYLHDITKNGEVR